MTHIRHPFICLINSIENKNKKMRIPITINSNTFKTYFNRDNLSNFGNLQSGNFSEWDKDIPKSLHELCLQTIADNFLENPVIDKIVLSSDRCLLLEILPVNLPLSLTVPKIRDNIYWKRCYLDRWPKQLPSNVSNDFYVNEIVKIPSSRRQSSTSDVSKSRRCSVNSQRVNKTDGERKNADNRDEEEAKSWKECFIEMYTRGYLEKLKPEDYEAEKMKELSDLCGEYVRVLNIRELQCSENSSNHIPLNSILTGFGKLTELSICFKQIYCGENFSWNVLRVSVQDVKLLAKGLEKCSLKIFKLTNSEIDDEKALMVLKSLLKHENLQKVDFSHCIISDLGAVGLSKFVLNNSVQEIVLTNNKITSKGVEALCYAICQNECKLTSLDLRLNPIKSQGGSYLINALTMGARNIQSIYLSGCGLSENSDFSIGEMIETNSRLKILDLSNNSLGEETGRQILKGLKYNTNLIKLDLRLCNVNPQTEFAITEKIDRNQRSKKSEKTSKKPIIVEPPFEFKIPEELLNEIEHVFENVNTNITKPSLIEIVETKILQSSQEGKEMNK